MTMKQSGTITMGIQFYFQNSFKQIQEVLRCFLNNSNEFKIHSEYKDDNGNFHI